MTPWVTEEQLMQSPTSPEAWLPGRTYIDPGQIGGSSPVMNYGQEDPGYQNIQDVMSQLRDAIMPLPPAESMGKGWQDPRIQKYAAENLAGGALGFGAPATIQMGGKLFKNAMLHRGLENPRELDWWAKLFQRGLSSEKPTSVVTPSVLQTFRSEPYGLLFDVPDQSKIRIASPVDVWTNKGILPPKSLEEGWNRLISKLPDIPFDTPRRGKYDRAVEKLDDLWSKARQTGRERWTPGEGHEGSLLDPQQNTLDELLGRQRDLLKSKVGADKWEAEKGLMPDLSNELLHSEVVPEIDRSMLAGVRLPLSGSGVNPSMAPWLKEQIEPRYNDLVRSLTDFAQSMNVPIYRWPAVENQAQQLKGLEHPFAGKWGYKPGSRDYKTSSMLKEIFGIGMEDLP